jgi:YD repeat-containing protein
MRKRFTYGIFAILIVQFTTVIGWSQNCLLSRIIEADGDTISISHNANNHISSIGVYSKVKTNSEGYITEIDHQYSTESSISRETYQYDNSHNVIKYERFAGSKNEPDYIMKFTYNATHQLVESQSAIRAGQMYFYGYRVFSYPNTTTKNPSTIKAYDGDAHSKSANPDETITLTYDDKKTIGYPNPLDDFNPYSTHNVITAVVSEVGQKPKTETFGYQYNAEGYPISKTEKEGGKTYVTSYSYQCK